jgi:hypothetical protein
MTLDEQTSAGSLREVAALLGVPDADAVKAMGVDSLRRHTHRQLIEVARRLGISGHSRMTKEVLAAKLWESLSKPARVGPPVEAPGSEPPGEDGHLTHKFEVGEHGEATEEPRTIPWSYSMDRVTAMPVDPDRLFAYWEITDDAIARTRPQLGGAGAGAWLNLRVYDTTGLIFDGTNAHSYFDHKVERHERQWFFHIGKPSSQAVIEVGLRSTEGYFVKIARSGRVDFPRRGPGAWSDPEWMTVRLGMVEAAGRGMPGGAQSPQGGAGEALRFDQIPLWQQFHGPGGEQVLRTGESSREERVQWEEVWRDEHGEVHRTVSWESPLMVSSWEAGPFTYPVEIPGSTTESFEGALNVYKVDGKTHIVYGPWQVVIRGLGAHYQRQVVARWEVQRSWVAEEGHEIHGVRVVSHEGAGPGGSSELLAMGSSELRWRGESELRLMGGSERLYLGASERRAMGASERLYRGASEWLARGASERRWAGESELRMKGASERLLGGASELSYRGASERMLGGASERRLGGASERTLGGGSEHRLDDEGSEGQSAYPHYPQTSSRSG